MADITPNPTAIAAQTQMDSLRSERESILGYIEKKNARLAVIDALLAALQPLAPATAAPGGVTVAGSAPK